MQTKVTRQHSNAESCKERAGKEIRCTNTDNHLIVGESVRIHSRFGVANDCDVDARDGGIKWVSHEVGLGVVQRRPVVSVEQHLLGTFYFRAAAVARTHTHALVLLHVLAEAPHPTGQERLHGVHLVGAHTRQNDVAVLIQGAHRLAQVVEVDAGQLLQLRGEGDVPMSPLGVVVLCVRQDVRGETAIAEP